MTSPTVRVTDLGYDYGRGPALAEVSFELHAGDFLALLGPNGAGKSTLFALLTRLLRPATGAIELFGHSLQHSPGHALGQMGVVFQQPTLDLDLSVAQNLSYHGAIQGLGRRQVKARMDEELERFDLSHRANDKVRALNGGHRRRVEIARALLHQPRLLLLDEATAGLDLPTRSSLYQHVRGLCRERGMAVLWTTHLVEELQAEDDTLILHRGKPVARGPIGELQRQHGAADFTELLLTLAGSNA